MECYNSGYILNRREYLGHTVLGKTTRDNFKTKRKRIANEDELLVFYNTHEAIIDQETYDKAQRMRKGYLQGETVKSLRTGCQDCFIVRIVEADWHISIQSQKMGKYMTAIRHSGVAGTTINIIHVLVTISRQAQ